GMSFSGLRVPPLRERVDDIEELAEEFFDDFSMDAKSNRKILSSDALELLKNYNWPGNVRELKNLVERLAIMYSGQVIRAEDIPPPFNTSRSEARGAENLFSFKTLKQGREMFERQFIAHKLEELGGNISKTAESIGVERSNLHKKIKYYGL
ncbi:MAG: helix-turn-helix domain-containing protein, partial [Thermodesulfobacteriota bacterium]